MQPSGRVESADRKGQPWRQALHMSTTHVIDLADATDLTEAVQTQVGPGASSIPLTAGHNNAPANQVSTTFVTTSATPPPAIVNPDDQQDPNNMFG